jgi:branched-chain amino acid transport system substrate-binding protein
MAAGFRQRDGKVGAPVTVSIVGRVSIGIDDVLIGEEGFPGRQGRLVFVYLVAESGRPVSREELADALWGEQLPATWEKALTVIVSKLRGLLEECRLDVASVLMNAFGCYRLDLPEGSIVDLHVAAEAIEAAEVALAAGELDKAKELSERAVSLARLPFLQGDEGRWVEQKRREQSEVLSRGLGFLAEASLRFGEAAEAVRYAEEEIAVEPYRDSGYRRLMQAHAVGGNRAEALRVYERCRTFLADELGAYPSPETESIYRELLKAPDTTPPDEAGLAPRHPADRPAGRLSARRARIGALGATVLVAAAIGVAAVTSRGTVQLQTLGLDRCSPLVYEGRGAPQLLIAGDLPLQRGLLATTTPMVEAMTLALALHGYRAGRFRVGLQVCDDAQARDNLFSDRTCAANAHAFVVDRSVIGVVGPYASGCAASEIPILNRAPGGPVAVVSPTNTLVGLTRQNSETAPGEPAAYYPSGRRNYARVIPADDVQGAADAILAHKLGGARAYVLDDGGNYGAAVTSSFTRTARRLGMAVVGRGSWNVDATTYVRRAATIARTRPDCVFLGGTSSGNALRLLRDLRSRLGRSVRFVAPDGFNPDTAALAGAAAEGMAISKPYLTKTLLGRAGREFVASYSHKMGEEPSGSALNAAQAIDVLLDAIARSDGTRASVTKNLFTTRISNGILGSFFITSTGDTTLNTVSFSRIVRGKVTGLGAIVVPDDLVPGA